MPDDPTSLFTFQNVAGTSSILGLFVSCAAAYFARSADQAAKDAAAQLTQRIEDSHLLPKLLELDANIANLKAAILMGDGEPSETTKLSFALANDASKLAEHARVAGRAELSETLVKCAASLRSEPGIKQVNNALERIEEARKLAAGAPT